MSKRLLLLLAMICSCVSHHNKQPVNVNTVDTNVIPIATDSNVPVDTNDHNKGSVPDEPLDSPVGPHHPKHTAEQH